MIHSGLSSGTTSVSVMCNNSTHTDIFSEQLILNKNARFVFNVTSEHYRSIESQQQAQDIQYSHRGTRNSNTTFPLIIPPIEQYSTLPLFPLTHAEDSNLIVLYAAVFVPASTVAETGRNKVTVNGHRI